jgi:ornithine cyclodeaminase
MNTRSDIGNGLGGASREPSEKSTLLYIDKQQVEACLRRIVPGPIERERTALIKHYLKETTLPEEASIYWSTTDGEARSLAMPAAFLREGIAECVGLKIINANPGNVRYGIPRAFGLFAIFHKETARIVCIMPVETISAIRTACVSRISASLLCVAPARIAIIGAGVQGATHIRMFISDSPLTGIKEIVIYDLDRCRAEQLRAQVRPYVESAGVSLSVAESAEAAVRGSQVIVTATTTTRGYIPWAWLEPGCLVLHVSLDDLLPEVVLQADKVFVDDWSLTKSDTRRLCGRLYRSGGLVGPVDAVPNDFSGRRVDAELGAVIVGAHPGREHDKEVIVVNPFGLGIEDLALASGVYEVAKKEGIGHELPT